MVTDKQGQPVGNLSEQDFRVWEDGKEQPVRNASFAAANPGATYVVFLFDNPALDPGGEQRARQAAVRFVDANSGQGHWVAIADFTGTGIRTTQNFTGDSERLKRVLLETHPLAGGTGRGAPVFGMPGGAFGIGRMGPGTAVAAQAERNLSSLGLALRELAQNLANVPGRKMVVLFSAPVLVNPTTTALTTPGLMFNRWNVSLYPVNTADADLPAPFQELARTTGGFVSSNSHDLDHELARLGYEKDGYYTLSYVPPETPDGSCHGLRVKVDRGGVEVRARSTYCNVKTPDLLAGTPLEKELEGRATGAEAGNLAATLAVPYFYSERGLARVRLAMEIPTKHLKFVKAKERLRAELQVLAIAYQPDGGEGARFSDTVRVDSPASEMFHYEGEFEVASGQYTLKVVVSAGGEDFGKLEAPLAVDPFDGQHIALSGLALAKDIRPAADPGEARDMQLLDNVTPLLYQNLRLDVWGENWFRKGAGAAIYGEVYEPLPPSGNPPPVELRLTIVDLATGKVTPAGASKLDAFRPGEFAAMPFVLNLSSLAPGRYRAEVEAVGAAARRTLEFEVR